MAIVPGNKRCQEEVLRMAGHSISRKAPTPQPRVSHSNLRMQFLILPSCQYSRSKLSSLRRCQPVKSLSTLRLLNHPHPHQHLPKVIPVRSNPPREEVLKGRKEVPHISKDSLNPHLKKEQV